jgi:hypothetical protein
MSAMTRLLERLQLVEGFPAVDLSSGAHSGDYVSLKNYSRMVVLFTSGIGTNGDDPTLTIEQAQDVGGTGHKALNFTRLYKKQATTNLTATGQWTEVTQAAANTYTNTDAAEQSALWAVEFSADELDVANNFTCVRATVADVGTNAQPGYLLYLLGDPRFPAGPDAQLSAIVD